MLLFSFNRLKGGARVKMKVKSIKYGKKFNLGNFETEYLEMEAEVSEEESVDNVVKTVKNRVNALVQK